MKKYTFTKTTTKNSGGTEIVARVFCNSILTGRIFLSITHTMGGWAWLARAEGPEYCAELLDQWAEGKQGWDICIKSNDYTSLSNQGWGSHKRKDAENLGRGGLKKVTAWLENRINTKIPKRFSNNHNAQ